MRCKTEGCTVKSAVFGLKDSIDKYCNIHKTSEMVDLVNLKCNHVSCNIQPRYGVSGGKATVCSQHKHQ